MTAQLYHFVGILQENTNSIGTIPSALYTQLLLIIKGMIKWKNISYCVISDDRKHDVALVYEVQKSILADLKCKFPRL